MGRRAADYGLLSIWLALLAFMLLTMAICSRDPGSSSSEYVDVAMARINLCTSCPCPALVARGTAGRYLMVDTM